MRRERIGRERIGRERIGLERLERDFIGARFARIGRARIAARLAIRLERFFCLAAFFSWLEGFLTPSFLSLRLMLFLRRFFIAILSFLLSLFTRLEPLDDDLPSLTAIPEGFLAAGLVGPLGFV